MTIAYKPKFQESMIPHLPAPESLNALPTAFYDSNTNTFFLSGDFDQHMGLKNHAADPAKPLIIDGQHKTLFKNRISIQDCKNVVFKRFEVHGGIELNNSYIEKGLENILFEEVTGKWSYDRGLFLGCYTAKNLVFKKCKILYTIFGTHGMYFSGGHWPKSPEPVDGITLIECEIAVGPGGRHALQFNGRFKNVLVEKCIFRNFQLCGISCIGVQNATFRNNISLGHNRGSGIVIYDYASHWGDQYNYFKTQADIDLFLATHWPNQNIKVVNNTFVVGPKQFSIDAYHGDDPTHNHPAVHINNAVHSGFFMWDGEKTVWMEGFDFPTKDIWIVQNVLHSPNLNLIEPANEHEGMETRLVDNLAWSTKPGIPYIGGCGKVGHLKGGIYKDPQFQMMPEYSFINLIENPAYDWTQFVCNYDLHSPIAGPLGMGAYI